MNFRRHRFRAHRARGQRGFTLPELIIALAIETVIFGALATAFVVVLNGGNTVNENLKRTSDARFAAAYIISDARNSSGPEISLADITSCPDPNPPVTGAQTPVARFNWTTSSAAGTTTNNISTYVLVGASLLRRHCEAGVRVSDAELASSVASVTVACAPIADCTGAPTSITVTITSTLDAQAAAGSTPYTYSLTAAFRKAISNGSPATPSPPQSLVVFGSGGCGVNISGGSTVGMQVYGNAFINTADGAGCHAIDLSGSGKFTAGSTSILEGGTCFTSNPWGAPCPVSTPYSPAITDPYGALVPPSTTGRPNQTNVCSGTYGSATAQPGVYAGAFVVGGSMHCTLASGIYILQNGFAVGAGATLDTAPGGVLLYLTHGQFKIDGAAVVTLAATTDVHYKGVVVWQAAADTSTFNINAGGAVVFQGAIYAPKATLVIDGNAQATKVTAIAVQTVVMSGSGGVVVGASPVPLSISPATPPTSWTVNRAYPSTTFTATGGDGHYAWSATGLPSGMAINTTTGVLSGTPTVVGTATVTITVNDALGDDPDTQSFSLAIRAAPSITTSSPLPDGKQGLGYSTTLAGSGGATPYSWAATGLPAGIGIDAGTGVISGTPTAAGTATVAVTLTDASGATATKSLTLVVAVPVAGPAISSVTLANGTGTPGRLDQGDTVTVVFSAQMDVSDFCSAWSSDTSNQTLNARNNVTVSVANGTHRRADGHEHELHVQLRIARLAVERVRQRADDVQGQQQQCPLDDRVDGGDAHPRDHARRQGERDRRRRADEHARLHRADHALRYRRCAARQLAVHTARRPEVLISVDQFS